MVSVGASNRLYKTSDEQVFIVILNWNGWRDTIACIESVLGSDYPEYRVIVCDNGSEDGSLQRIKTWAEGGLGDDTGIAPVRKPIPYVELSRVQTEGWVAEFTDASTLVLIDNGENLGFAGGYNVALRFILRCCQFGYCWLLNNDTLVQPAALSRLIDRMREGPACGIVGSTLLHYERSGTVQACGGAKYNEWLGTHRLIGGGQPAKYTLGRATVERSMDYVIGASMLVSRAFLADVGLLSEDYFLYFEEIDWAARAHPDYTLAYAPDSIVYHKGGASVERINSNAFADYLALRNRLLFTYKHYPWALPSVWLGLFAVLFNRARRGQLNRLPTIMKIMLGWWRPGVV